jgi:hypothetical protein
MLVRGIAARRAIRLDVQSSRPPSLAKCRLPAVQAISRPQWNVGFCADTDRSLTTAVGPLTAHAGRCGPSPKRLPRSRVEQWLDVLIGRVAVHSVFSLLTTAIGQEAYRSFNRTSGLENRRELAERRLWAQSGRPRTVNFALGYTPVTASLLHSGSSQCTPVCVGSRTAPAPGSCISVN